MADPMLDRIIEMQVELATRYLGERIKAQNILNQHGANFTYLDGQYRGRLLKLPDEVLANVTPFPKNTTVMVSQEKQADDPVDKAIERLEELKKSMTPEKSNTAGLAKRLAPWLLAAGLGGWGIYQFATPDDAPDIAPPAAVQYDPSNHGVGFTVE